MAPQRKFVIYGLRETYHELGNFNFKVILDPKYFKNGHCSEVTILDSDGKSLKYHAEKWGRKINCSFSVDNSVADGVATINMTLKDNNNKETLAREIFWIIKP